MPIDARVMNTYNTLKTDLAALKEPSPVGKELTKKEYLNEAMNKLKVLNIEDPKINKQIINDLKTRVDLMYPETKKDGLTAYQQYQALQDLAKEKNDVNTAMSLGLEAFGKIGISVKGIHEFESPVEAIEKAEGIFTGGGNTFELVNQLYKNNLIDVLKDVLEKGTPYLGTSAGSNICGVTMMNTNDMPIVYPPSFHTLEMIPFNINAHYLDPNPDSTHMGETRETRIKEYHVFNETPVLGLREGSWLEVIGSDITLKGNLTARWFQKDRQPIEIDVNRLLNDYI